MASSKTILAGLTILILAFACAGGLLPSSFGASPQVPIIDQPATRICSILYVWYGFNQTSLKWTGGLKTSHWNDTSGGIVKDTPYYGYYSSMAEIPEQLQLIQEAGLNCVIVSWWGWGVTNFSKPTSLNMLDEAINNATKEVFADVEAMNSTFQVGLLVDAFNTTDLSASAYTQIYNYTWDNFYAPYINYTISWQDKPLLMWFNPLVPPANSTFTSRVTGNNLADAQWIFWKAPGQFFDSYGGTADPGNGYVGNPPVSNDGFVSIIPSYDDYYLYLAGSRPGYMRVDYQLSQGLYQQEWSDVIQQEKSSNNIRLVVIYSWNEYHEQSAIEPHSVFTNPNAQDFYLYDLTQQYTASMEAAPTTYGYSGFFVASFTMLGVIAVLGLSFYGVKMLRKK